MLQRERERQRQKKNKESVETQKTRKKNFTVAALRVYVFRPGQSTGGVVINPLILGLFLLKLRLQYLYGNLMLTSESKIRFWNLAPILRNFSV